MPGPAGNRRTPLFRLHVQRPERILDAALELFVRSGYQKSRIEDVARSVGVTKPAIYHHFASKQALLEEVVARFCLPVEPPSGASPEQMLQHGLADERAAQVLELVIAEARPLPGLGPHYMQSILKRLAQWPQFAVADTARLATDIVGRAAAHSLFGTPDLTPEPQG